MWLVSETPSRRPVSLDNLTIALHRYGARLEDLVKTSVYVVGDRHDLAPCGKSSRWFGALPSTSTLLVFPPWLPGQLVEIEGIAALPA